LIKSLLGSILDRTHRGTMFLSQLDQALILMSVSCTEIQERDECKKSVGEFSEHTKRKYEKKALKRICGEAYLGQKNIDHFSFSPSSALSAALKICAKYLC
jgi:hypothetical protein